MSDSNQSQLAELRHSAAHLLAAAVMELYPTAKRTIGPSIDQGFYYDFDFGDLKITESDLPKIEKKMRQLVTSWKKFERHVHSEAEVKAEFEDNPYKLELINEFSGEGATLTVYQSGSFRDLCRGGHVEDPSKVLKYFKLTKLAGAYWRGDEKNKMLTRIYGTAFFTAEELEHYLWLQEEAKKRDHRKLGKTLELFLSSPSVGSGFPLYMPKGWLIRHELEKWIISEKQSRGYQFVWTPHVGKSDLYKQSGHWQKYDAMMSPMKIDDEEYVVKPMNCPHHFQIYNESPHSYRELPLRLAEIATVYRYEKAGEVNGLLRVRALTQDDTHTFVRHDQISEEIDRIIELTKHVYSTFGFSDYQARISVRDPHNPDKYMGIPKVWDQAEKSLEEAAKRHNIPYFVGEGEAAFYGPKIDIVVKDALGRDWQLTTIQLDFVQPENFDMTYADNQGVKVRPAVLHLAILGSLDRFMGILIEHYAGAFPLWLAPVQLALLPISEGELTYARAMKDSLAKAGLRVELDESSATLGKKMVKAREQKLPYFVIIGKQEVENHTLTLKNREGDQQTLTLDEAIAKLTQEVLSKV